MRGNTSCISMESFRLDWATHMPMRSLCERWTITRDQVIRLADVWHLPRRHDRRLRAKPVRQRDPTTTEIRMACLKIQAQWDERTANERLVTKVRSVTTMHVEIPDEARDIVNEIDGEPW